MTEWRRAVAGAIVAGLAVAGCGGAGGSGRARARSEDRPTPVGAAPAESRAPTMGIVAAGPPVSLPEPVDIPKNSYAPEPVVQIGTIEIPKLRLVHRVYDGVTLNNIDLGPSHWPGSAEPGQVGNTVFAGHRVTHDSPFRHLDELDVGDKVVFDVGGVRSVYHVTASMVVEAADSWIADQTPTPTGTLYACHPPGSVDQRYVVRLALDSPSG